ncbi:PTS IIA-like nitrogen regulatory protein PtsN [Amylibacter sp. SFDW26]|uniref:PTS IIA-like nitrogen regulatory protein PtsN n=1 Tax=Amylibacter sp. SFDW26 TaxID=2652722 RepID=UPI001261C62C|nr:PTS IIA-like nitrogen regulatory protein PtsN [Amylibacter sp. SFDW26]KAB7614543.1 PTS IIA-like nitrogen regulatory protein PtsN [Amylibacter sp. SFDW26]
MELTEILVADAVHYAQSASSKKRLLQKISEQAASIYDLDSEQVFAALTAREALGTTGVGRGVAIPHARFENLDRVVGLFTRLEKPLDYDSMDHQAVDLVFTLLAPQKEGAEHLKALALVSRTLRDEDVCSKLRSNNDAQTIFSILVEKQSSQAA